jgi:hypothetical protein
MALVNEQCRDQAEKASATGNHLLAYRWYNTAAGRTIGHKKSDRYHELAANELAKSGIDPKTIKNMYAEDSEAV